MARWVATIVDMGGQVEGWLAADGDLTRVYELAVPFPTRESARLAGSKAVSRWALPDGYGTSPEPLHERPVPVTVLGPVPAGSVLVARAPVSFGPAHLEAMRDRLVRMVGHDQFGLVFAGSDESTVELLRPADLAEIGWVYVGSPGVCPICGSSEVTVTPAETLARVCHRCGHRWSQFHPATGSAA